MRWHFLLVIPVFVKYLLSKRRKEYDLLLSKSMRSRIGLIDVDGHNFPNLCLMKLSAYHKARGDTVEWYDNGKQYDLVYMSRIFTNTYSKDYEGSIKSDCVIKGGTGYGLDNKLPDAVEHAHPDYGLYRAVCRYSLRFSFKRMPAWVRILHCCREGREKDTDGG